jgi:ABC-type polysaccharide/polyol phosphate export permease
LLVDLPIPIIPAMIIACMTLAMIGCGSGLLLSPFVTIAKDLSKIIAYVLLLGLFLQCVLYPFSITEGYHRQVLSFMPHTIVVEWCRSIASNSPNPFSFSHSALVLFLWSFPMLWGFVRFDRYRWRSTTW